MTLPITSGDLKFYLSGAVSNTNPTQSLGGAISSTQITDNTLNNLWSDVTGDQAAAGIVQYRCAYFLNANGSLTFLAPVIWVTALTTSPDDEIAIGIGTSGLNGIEQTISSDTTAPTGVTFSTPTTKASGLALGTPDIPAGQHVAVWFRRTVNAGAAGGL
jgi:hypothetical protein